MSEYRKHILKAIKLKADPPSSHQKLKKILSKESKENKKWKNFLEYQVIETTEGYVVIDFLNKKSKQAIYVGEGNVKSIDYKIVTISETDVLNGGKGISAMLQGSEITLTSPPPIKPSIQKVSSNTDVIQIVKSTNNFQVESAFAKIAKSESEIEDIDSKNQDIVQTVYHSREEINDLIGITPGWLQHSGITMIAIILTLILLLSHLISYPDKILASAYISTERAPLELRLHHGGRIAEIYQEHGSLVQKGDILLYLDNPANKLDVAYARKLMHGQDYNRLHIEKTDLALGPMQNHFAQFLTILREYHHVRAQKTVADQTATLESEIRNIDRLNSSIAKEEEHYRVEQEMAVKEFKRAKVMIDQGLIAQQEYERIEAQYNQFLRQLEQTDKSRIQNSIRQDQLNLEQTKIQAQRKQQLQDYRFRLNEISIQFMAAYDQWYEEYHLITEVGGQLDWASRYAEGQMIDAGRHIGYILPKEEQSKVLVTSLGPQGYARLDSTTRVIVKSHAHPYKEYGVLQSTISHMASIAYTDAEGQALYQLYIPMDSVMVTSYDKVLAYRPNMSADVELITEDRSVLSRIFGQFTNLINNKPSKL